MRKLIAGILKFRRTTFPRHSKLFNQLAFAQAPDTLFISCSDSRVVPDLIASTDPGELFTVRNVGNLIPPAYADGKSTGDVSEASAIEYAVLVLNVKNIVVCGHSECGAMKAVISGKSAPDTPNLTQWLSHARGATERLSNEDQSATGLSPHDRLSQLNVLAQIEHLFTYDIVRDRTTRGMLKLSGMWFDIASGSMHAYDEELKRFAPVDSRLRADPASSRRAP